MSSLEDNRQEFNQFMRKLTGDSRFLAYYDDAKRLMRLLADAAPILSLRCLSKQEMEPIRSKAEYILAKISQDRRSELRDTFPSCLRAVAYQLGNQTGIRLLMVQMAAVSQEIMVVQPSVRPQRSGKDTAVRHDSEPAR
ncbi:MAG: hypothetical protein WC551_02800 [Patescibacteria group bacterium]